MSISQVASSIHIARTSVDYRQTDGSTRDSFARLKVGQRLRLDVLNRVDQQHFTVSLEGKEYLVESKVPLTVGGTASATVVAIGDQLELKYVEPEQLGIDIADSDMSHETDASSVSDEMLADLQNRYRVALDHQQRMEIAHATAKASQPSAMALSGLFLGKLGLPIQNSALQAVYSAQIGMQSASADAPVDMSALVLGTQKGDDPSCAALAKLLEDSNSRFSRVEDAIAYGDPQLSATSVANLLNSSRDSANSNDSSNQHDLAKHLLNTQDGGSVAYRFGTLPVLVSGQLIELDLVLFQQRQSDAAQSDLRRLVMTLKTESLGQLQVTAQALNNRLIITFSGESVQAADSLASHADEVRNLVQRLGWDVDAVGYEFNPTQKRAAEQVVAHVLNAGTVDRVI